jgi:hypothetical protein
MITDPNEPAAGRLLAMARDCEGLASHFISMDQRRYADGIALSKVWHALNRIEHVEGTGLPAHVNADELADTVVAFIRNVRAAVDCTETPE